MKQTSEQTDLWYYQLIQYMKIWMVDEEEE